MSIKYTKCRVTNEKIPIIFSYGIQPIANDFNNAKNFSKDTKFEMKTAFNKKNYLFQLADAPKPVKLFNKNYSFLSSTSKNMEIHFKTIANKIKLKHLKKNGSIMEIGCNDGIFLKNFKKYNHYGIEPSRNVFLKSKNLKLNVYNYFFNSNTVKNLKIKDKFDCIFSANVICHIPDLNDLFANISACLKDNGVFIFEEPYLGSMVEKTSYDQIYDEHFYMFSIHSIKAIIKKFNLNLFHAEALKTHGGSMRYYICKNEKRTIQKSIKKLLKHERRKGYNKISTIRKFSRECLASKKRILNNIRKLKKQNLTIYGYGAASKSTTILNFCNISKNDVKGIFDTSKTKIGKLSPGKKIPIIDYKLFSKIKPRYCFLFAWNHYKEIFEKEKRNNIKWITHIDKNKFPKKYQNKFI